MSREADERAILEVLEKYKETIHTQNEDDFRKIWSQNRECTLISIRRAFHGLDSIVDDFLIDGIHKAYTKIDLISESVSINLIEPDAAIIVFGYHTDSIRRESGEPYGIQGLETQVMIKEDGKWKLVHIHYSK